MYALPEYQVEREEIEADQINVHVVPLTAPPSCCIQPNLVKFGKKEVFVRDVPLGSQALAGVIHRQRFRCSSCKAVRSQNLPGISEKHQMTERLVRWIESEAAERPFREVGNRCSLNERIIRVVFSEYIDAELSQLNLVTPSRIGLDEVRIGKATRAVVTNLAANTIIDLLPDRNAATISAFLGRLPVKSAVKLVAMDIWPTYRDAVRKQLPHAQVVVDRWHVEAACVAALESVRKEVRKSTPKSGLKTLANDRVVLLKNEAALNPSEREALENIFLHHPVLKLAHSVKEGFKEVYDAKDADEAGARYSHWRRCIPPEVQRAFRPFYRQCDDWQAEIFAFVETRLTNAFTENAVGQIRDMLILGSGYSFEVLRAKVLLTSQFRKRERRFKRAKGSTSTQMSFGARGNAEVMDFGVDTGRLERFLSEIRDSGEVRRFGLMEPVSLFQAKPVFLDISHC